MRDLPGLKKPPILGGFFACCKNTTYNLYLNNTGGIVNSRCMPASFYKEYRMKKNLLLALILSATAMSANAGDWYIGADVGQANHSPAAYTDDTDTSFGVNAGYAYTKNLAVEVAYTDLGNAATGAVGTKTKAADISAVGTYDLGGGYGLFGRLGYASVESTTLAAANRHESLTYGAGASYRLTEAWGVRGGVNRYNLAGGDHVTNVGLGLRYSFQ